jgi:phosphoribosylformylglycinamidine (FGAM) synthase-like enzyme
MYDTNVALKDAMVKLEITIDGGKNSLSMVTQAGIKTIKALGNLVISTYVTCPDITKTIIPDLKVCYCRQESCKLFNLQMALKYWHAEHGYMNIQKP